MSQAELLTGRIGGIIGFITAGIGITWSIVYIALIDEINTYLTPVNPIPNNVFPFLVFSTILVVSLIISCILIGESFHRLSLEGGGAMGKVGLIFGILGSVLGALFIALGNVINRTVYGFGPEFLLFFIVPYEYKPLLIIPHSPEYVPEFFFIEIGMMIFAVTFVILGATSMALRKNTANPSGSMAAGIFSIIGGCFLFPYIPDVFERTSTTIIFLQILSDIAIWDTVLSALIGFGLILVAFILWAVVFYSPKHITILGEVEVLPAIKPALRSIILNCLHCGAEIPEYANFCPHCGEARARCSVCQTDIISGDNFLECSHCGALSHRDHLLEWIKVRGTCPSCKKKLSQLDIV